MTNSNLSALCLAAFVMFAGALSAQSFADIDWQLDESPPGRTGATFTYDAAMATTVLFGGSQQEPYGDTWLYDGGWRRLDLDVSPSPRSSHATAYDSMRQRLVLFGGNDASGLRNDTWAFDANGWTQLAPTASPPPTAGHAMAYDPGRDRVVLIGGSVSASGGSSVTMWEFDGATWTLSVPGSEPSSFGRLVYDEARGELLSSNGTGLRAWDGISWQSRDNSGLPAGASGQPIYDAGSQRVLLPHPRVGFNEEATVYAWAGNGWTLVGTPITPLASQLRVYDVARQRVVALDVLSFSATRQLTNTWELEAMAWKLVALGPPMGRANAAMAYDVARQRMVLYGGRANSDLYETWELADRQWFLGSSGSGGTGRAGHTMVYDESRAVTVLLGGESQYASYVLEWNGNGTWNYATPSFAPQGRRNHSAVYDRLRARMLIFGGQALQPAVADLWAWNGLTWSELTPATGPAPRRDAGMSYDAARDRVVLFGGTNGVGATFGDTWEFDGVQWLPITPMTSPPARSGHVQVYDSHLQRTIVYGGTNGTQLHDTWLWDGLDWTLLSTAHHPDAGSDATAAYDPVRREVVLFGGSVARGEMWRLRDTTLGSWTSTGPGCNSGNGSLTLTALDPLAIGTVTRLELTNLPDTFFVLPIAWVGFDDQQWDGVPLPLLLDVLGSPDCALRTQPIVPLYMQATGGGAATVSLDLPEEPGFVGDRLFLQGFSWDFAQPRIATGNLLTGTIGVR